MVIKRYKVLEVTSVIGEKINTSTRVAGLFGSIMDAVRFLKDLNHVHVSTNVNKNGIDNLIGCGATWNLFAGTGRAVHIEYEIRPDYEMIPDNNR